MNVDIEFYVNKYKEHEANRTTTNQRQQFWKEYNESQNNENQ